MKRVTCHELGKKLGLSHMTVSRALRESPTVAVKTRERVRKLADKMGYRPDPVLSALNFYRQASRGYQYQATLAWINPFPDPASFRQFGDFALYVEGAQKRAEELGYKLEEFWLPTRKDWPRLGKILKARRIDGVLVPPSIVYWSMATQDAFPWNDFSAVALGELAGPPLHLIVNNQFQSAVLTVQRLHALGYEKIGIVMPKMFAGHTDFHFLGGYLSECANRGIPPLFFLEDSGDEIAFKKRTVRWLKQHKLQAIIAPGAGDILPALQSANLRVPEDLAVAFLNRDPQYPDIAGIDQNGRQIGVAGANLLIDLIRRNERGIPDSPMRLLVRGTWVDGASAPQRGTKTLR